MPFYPTPGKDLRYYQRNAVYERVKELTVKQVSENEKMSEDAVQDIFHFEKFSPMPKQLSIGFMFKN